MLIGLDEETRRQLNRVEAMLHAICDKEGIIPSTLPGYEQPRSASPSTHSMSSASGPMERLQLSDAGSEPPRKLGMFICAYRMSYTGCLTLCISQKRLLRQGTFKWACKLE